MSSHKVMRNFVLGCIRLHILHHASKEPVYGAWLIEELSRHGYDLSPGTLYPILHSLEKAGLVTREEQLVDGRIRKYYTTTAAGRAALEDAKPRIADLVHEILEGE